MAFIEMFWAVIGIICFVHIVVFVFSMFEEGDMKGKAVIKEIEKYQTMHNIASPYMNMEFENQPYPPRPDQISQFMQSHKGKRHFRSDPISEVEYYSR